MSGVAEGALALQAARRDREQAEEALAESRRKQVEEHKTIIVPLRKTRRDMLEHNHVTETVLRQIRKEGA